MKKIEGQLRCWHCSAGFIYREEDAYWDEKGYGYSLQWTRCPSCGSILILRFVEDRSLYVNTDPRYYKK